MTGMPPTTGQDYQYSPLPMGSNILAILSIMIKEDSYKHSHYLQYPEGTTKVGSYIEARGSKLAEEFGEQYNYAEFFGLQAFLKDHLAVPITQEDIDTAEIICAEHGIPFHREGWQYILDEHDGRLPVRVDALPEGTVAETKNALVKIENTDENCEWLTSFVETSILRGVWYPTTVATLSRIAKDICQEYIEETCDATDEEKAGILSFMLHDFAFRGVSSTESGALGGLAHIVNFLGTDTMASLVAAMYYYDKDFDDDAKAVWERSRQEVIAQLMKIEVDAKADDIPQDEAERKAYYENMMDEITVIMSNQPKKALLEYLENFKARGKVFPAFSVIASEHSTMTIKGPEGEIDQVETLIDLALNNDNTIASIVSDSYNYFKLIDEVYCGKFKDKIKKAGERGSKVVIRPDSGDPVKILLGDPEAPEGSLERKGTYGILEEKLGDEIKVNSKGYKVLPPYIGVLWGDGIDPVAKREILKAMKEKGWAAQNIVFGMGGGLLQKINRDDLKFAMKACFAKIKDTFYEVFKDPKTQDAGFSKKSKRGELATIWDGVAFDTLENVQNMSPQKRRHVDNLMQCAFENGFVTRHQQFDDVKQIAEHTTNLYHNPPKKKDKVKSPYELVAA